MQTRNIKSRTGIQRDVFYATGRRTMEPIGEQKENARPFVAPTRGYNVFTLFPLRIKRTSLVNNAAGQSPGMALTSNGREKARDSPNGIGSKRVGQYCGTINRLLSMTN